MADDVEARTHLAQRQRATDALADTPLGGMLDTRPSFLTDPVSSLDHRFRVFHGEHPSIYKEYERRALVQVRQGEARVSISLLTEAIRATTHLPINNSFRAHYARLLRHDHPELRSAIEIRGEAHV